MDQHLLKIVKSIIKEAGLLSISLRQLGLQVTEKADTSPVTNADKAISAFIYQSLSKYTPDIPVICEEREPVSIENKQIFWLIDPIDGTGSYIDNSSYFTINIALIEQNIAKYGLIYQPSTDHLYFTDERQQFNVEVGGKLKNNSIHDHQGFIAIISSRCINQETEQYLNRYNFLKILSIPSSVKLCMVAENSGDVYPKFTPTMEWDIAAGHALIRSTGGDIFTLDGKSMRYAKQSFTNPHFIAASKRWIDYCNLRKIRYY